MDEEKTVTAKIVEILLIFFVIAAFSIITDQVLKLFEVSDAMVFPFIMGTISGMVMQSLLNNPNTHE